MKRYNVTAVLALAVLVAACASMSESDRTKKQADIRQATQTALGKFYQAKPELRDEVAKAPGYAVFTTYGASLVVGGAGGKGIARRVPQGVGDLRAGEATHGHQREGKDHEDEPRGDEIARHLLHSVYSGFKNVGSTTRFRQGCRDPGPPRGLPAGELRTEH